MVEPLTIRQALAEAVTQGLPRSEAHWLMMQVLGCSRAWLIAHDDDPIAPPQAERWADWLTRRLAGVPLAYLTGHKEFHGLDLRVTPDVLDPRPDTETLVDWALERLDDIPAGAHVLDLGTGSGAIALALKNRRPDAHVSAVDASAAALAVARDNGQRLGLPVRWWHGSWFEPAGSERFDLIVSNPPYLADDDPHLPGLSNEPRQALVAGRQGLDDLHHLIAHAPAHLRPGGWLLLEHGFDQGAAVAAAFARQPGFATAQHRHDLAGHLRCTGASWQN